LTARMLGRSFGKTITANMFPVALLIGVMVPLAIVARNMQLGNHGLLSAAIPMAGVGLIGLIAGWFIVLDGRLKSSVKKTLFRWA